MAISILPTSEHPAPALAPAAGGRSVYLETFGCQMNELDSELVRGHLGALGYHFVSGPQAADVILYNTCSVREQAEQKVWSRLGIMGRRKKSGAQFIVGVIGCMAEREGPDMIRRFPQVDLMCGPGDLDKLPMLIDNAMKTSRVGSGPARPGSRAGASRNGSRNSARNGSRGDPRNDPRIALQGNTARRSSTLSAATDNLEMLDLARAFDPDQSMAGGRSAYVRITRGCNKFCTYCVVPYTRGAEVHRPPQAIIDECKRLADAGVIEVTLLGQTVNHYVYTHGAAVSAAGLELPQIGPGTAHARAHGAMRITTFARLLQRIHDEVPAIQRLRFLTSFPRDFGDDILHVMAACPRICSYLHAPAQSGSDRILKLMNRGYTAQQYLQFIHRARSILPEVCIAGDFIVGFPSETDDDFDLTRRLLETVRFKNNFIFKYSPRPGTVAIDRFNDDVPDDVKRRRNNELLALQARISAEVHQQYVGRSVEVFVEKISSAGRRSQPAGQGRGGLGGRGGRAAMPITISARPRAAHLAEPDPDRRESSFTQMSGRTSGDLITVFDCPPGQSPDRLIGRIVRVRVTGSAPLLLRGCMD